MTPSTPYSFVRLRASLVHFGIGQIANGLLAFTILLQIARGLPLVDYGAYVVLVAVIQISMTFSMLGLDTVAGVYVPQYRLHAPSGSLLRFLGALLSLRILTLTVSAVLLFALSPLWTRYLGLEAWRAVLPPFAVLVLLTGLTDYWQRSVFQPLLQQGAAQGVGLARNGTFSSLLLWASWREPGALSLLHVLQAELWAVSAAVLAGAGFLLRIWWLERSPRPDASAWEAPPLATMIRMSGYNFASQLLYSVGDAHMVLLVAGRMLDMRSTAALGFCLGLYGQLLRYLPSQLLWGVIQPKLVAAYSRGRDFVQLNRQAMLIYKSSLFVLAPLAAFFAVSSESTLNLLSHNKYGDAHWLALMLLATIIPASHRHVLAGLANTVERPQAGALGNLAALTTVPLGTLLILAGFGAVGLVMALAINALLYNAIVIRTLAASGHQYRVDYPGLLKIGVAVAATALCLSPFKALETTASIALGAMVAAGALFLVWAYWMKPFSGYERSVMNEGFGRPLFIW